MDLSEDHTSPGGGLMSHIGAADYDFPSSPPPNNENAMSDTTSFLSEPPTDMELHDADFNADHMLAADTVMPTLYEEDEGPVQIIPTQVQILFRTHEDSESDTNSDIAEDDPNYGDISADDKRNSASGAANSEPLEKFYKLKINSAVTKFEKLPYELISRIASLLPSDSDLASFIRTCHTFSRQLQPENSSVWKARFLQKYDYPIIKGPYEFRIAYQLRAVTLPRFGDLGFETKDKAKILLTILKDMVLETYNKPDALHASPRVSPNILAFSDAMKSEWMVHFLATRLFARDYQHPYGRLPNNKLFDVLQVVFSYLVLNRSPMAFQVGSDKTDYDLAVVYNWDHPLSLLFRDLPFRDWNAPVGANGFIPIKWLFKLDINSLVHIRNFWHRHLTESKVMGGEETFVNMAAGLAEVGISPKSWTQPLQQPSKLQTRWYGHYSCIYPWPKTRKQLEEKESEAEVWDTVDPLNLVFALPPNGDVAWPPIFSSIPTFAENLVHAHPGKGAYFIRGFAPFQPPHYIRSPPPQHTLSLSHHHPFTRLRLRGFVHPIKPQCGIPGWQRVVFVLYKPTFRYLNDVFDYATDYNGVPFEQTIIANSAALGLDLTYAESEILYQDRLEILLGALKGPVVMNGNMIEAMEDAMSDPEELNWGTIEYAYAYEGVITPGGMVMMGKWWRLGPPGGLYAVGGANEFMSFDRPDDRERGPFVFWAA